MNYSNVEKNINLYIKRKYLDMNLDSKDTIVNIEVNMDYIMKYWYNKNKQKVNLKNVEYRYFIMLSLNLNELEELYEITKDERIRDFMKELEGVNTLPEFRQFITEEQDIQFILNTERGEGMAEGEKKRSVKIKIWNS